MISIPRAAYFRSWCLPGYSTSSLIDWPILFLYHAQGIWFACFLIRWYHFRIIWSFHSLQMILTCPFTSGVAFIQLSIIECVMLGSASCDGGHGTAKRLSKGLFFPLNQTHTTGAHRATHELTHVTDPYLPWVARWWTHSGTMRDWDREKKQQKNNQNDQTNGTNRWWNNQMKHQTLMDMDREAIKGTLCLFSISPLWAASTVIVNICCITPTFNWLMPEVTEITTKRDEICKVGYFLVLSQLQKVPFKNGNVGVG